MIEGGGRRPLLVRAKNTRWGEVVRVDPAGGDWRYISFRVLRLAGGESFDGQTGPNETGIVIIEGVVDVRTADHAWAGIGGRSDPFSGPPAAVLLPPGDNYRIGAITGAEIAICGAPCADKRAARLVAPSTDDGYARGAGNARRFIRNIAMGDEEAGALFLTEVVTPPGNWSSYPPHKHDTDDPPHESALQELYYYRAQPAAGFALQRVYSADRQLDETVTAHDRDVVLVPRGFHACAAAEGYSIYYLNVLAGPKHVYRMSFDPAHAWIKEGWTW